MREINRTIHLYILLKPDIEIEMNLAFDRAKFKIGAFPVVGYLSLGLKPHLQDSVAYLGIIIHHEVARRKFGKEALFSVLDYILLDQPTKMGNGNGNLGGLGLSRAFVETGVQNVALQGLMVSLHLKNLAREGTPEHGLKKGMEVPSVTYTIAKADWLVARRRVVMEWMPEGQQTVSGNGSLNFSELGPECGYKAGSGHASGSGSGHAPGVGSSSIHGHGGHGAHK